LPAPTKISEREARKQVAKGEAESDGAGRQKLLPAPHRKSPVEARKQGANDNANSAGVGKIAADGKQKPSAAPKSKIRGIEIKKQDDKGKAEAVKVGDDGSAAVKSGGHAAPMRK
jgi:hypothetical protein